MGRLLEELDYRPTAMGPLVLRRRWVAAIDTDVVEVILGDEHLMSSLFTVGETELAVRGLASASGTDLRVLVGGLGLGYTAREALADPRVASVEVVDALAPVIEWHQAGLVPLGESLGRESRCRLVLGDFFGWFETRRPADAAYDVVLLDIDHSPPQSAPPGPRPLLFAGGAGPCAAGAGGERGIRHVVRRGPGPDFLALLESVFPAVRADVVAFDNPLTGGSSTCTIYLAGSMLKEMVDATGIEPVTPSV